MSKPTTVQQRIFWEYAKLIARSAVGASAREDWRFTNYTFQRLKRGEIRPSELTRDNKKLVVDPNACAYCGSTGVLQWEHIVPRSGGGPDTIDNQVQACGRCNRSKGSADLLAWRAAKDVPPLVLSKYLKLLLKAHDEAGTSGDSAYPPGEPLSLRALHKIFADR